MAQNKRTFDLATSQAEIVSGMVALVDHPDWPEARQYDMIGLLTLLGVTGASLVSKVGLVATWRLTFGNGASVDFTVQDGSDGINGTNGVDGAQGLPGNDAPQTQARYSANQTDWHSTFSFATDSYIQFSTDGGVTWTPSGGMYISAKEIDRQLDIVFLGHTLFPCFIGRVVAETITAIHDTTGLYALNIKNNTTTIAVKTAGVLASLPLNIPQGIYDFEPIYESGADRGLFIATTKKT